MGPGMQSVCRQLKALQAPATLGASLLTRARHLQGVTSSPKEKYHKKPSLPLEQTPSSVVYGGAVITPRQSPSTGGKSSISNMWGVTLPKQVGAADKTPEPALLISDSEEEAVPEGGASASTVRASSRFFDPVAKPCKRIWDDGRVEPAASMIAGDNGFAIAQFGDAEFETEVPNLLLMPTVLRKPARAEAKRKQAMAKAGLDDEAGDEDPEEQEAEDFEEEPQEPDVDMRCEGSELQEDDHSDQAAATQSPKLKQPKSTAKSKAKSEEASSKASAKGKAKASAKGKAKASAEASAKASAKTKVKAAAGTGAASTCPYSIAKASFTGTPDERLKSQARLQAINIMSVSEVIRRRLEKLRPDLFDVGPDGKAHRILS